jgi:hypothetical protein
VVSGGQVVEIRGTYAHPDLVPHIACWVSPDFAVKVSKIVNAHIVRKYKNALAREKTLVQEKDNTIVEQGAAIVERDTAITRLENTMADIKRLNIEQMAKIDAQSAEISILLSEVKAGRDDNQSIQVQLDNVTDDLDTAARANSSLSLQVGAIAVRLDVATDQRVPPTPEHKNDEVFAVLHYPGSIYYRMIRRQKCTYSKGLDACINGGYRGLGPGAALTTLVEGFVRPGLGSLRDDPQRDPGCRKEWYSPYCHR